MTWEIHYGERREFLQKLAARGGTPKALTAQPEPTSYTAPYLTAFTRLHSSRIIGPNGNPSGILFSEIEAYARIYGFDSPCDQRDLAYFVKVCDNVWMKEVAEINKREQKANAKSGKQSKARNR